MPAPPLLDGKGPAADCTYSTCSMSACTHGTGTGLGLAVFHNFSLTRRIRRAHSTLAVDSSMPTTTSYHRAAFPFRRERSPPSNSLFLFLVLICHSVASAQQPAGQTLTLIKTSYCGPTSVRPAPKAYNWSSACQGTGSVRVRFPPNTECLGLVPRSVSYPGSRLLQEQTSRASACRG